MKFRTVFTAVIQLIMCSILVFAVAFIGGCKGKTGDAGAPGANGTSVGLNDCDKCHHLNSLAVNEFNEIFIDGLAGSGAAIPAATSTTISFDASKLPSGETAQSFVWTRTNGQAATISAQTSSATSITLPAIANYKAELVRHINGLIVTTQSGTVLADRARIVPVNPLNLDEASSATFKLRVGTSSGKFYFGLVTVTDQDGAAAVANFAAIATGNSNVPVGVPVLLRSTNGGGYAWTLTPDPAIGSALTAVNDPTTQFADFTPDKPGQYTVTDGKGNTFTVFAGTWKGVITGQNATHRPTTDVDKGLNCKNCHDDQTAPDKFTPWMNSGHSEIFTQNFNGGSGTHWGSACFPCHTVGFDTATAAVNNGFDDQADYGNFLGKYFTNNGASVIPNQDNWTDLLATFPKVAQQANVQCENCHGPQEAGVGTNNTAHQTSANAQGPRTSMSADMCGICHGEPLRHARFQQWESSKHGNYEVAINEAAADGSIGSSANHCGRCHSAQGFLQWIKQPNMTLRIQGANGDATVAELTALGMTKATVAPQTCQVCHDPHAQGTTSGKPNTATVRFTDNTPKLPAGFAATGVGRGAVCIVCHNSRNGVPTGGSDAFLHQDGDPVWGNLTAYAAPHEANQGDVVMGFNAYFVGSGSYRSPHSLITDSCTNCHMEQTPPPALLSYSLSGTNHTFKPSLNICDNCHTVNTALGPMLQEKVRGTVDQLGQSILDKIVSRNTGTTLTPLSLTTSHGSPAVSALLTDGTPTTINVGSIPGIDINTLGTDDLAKAIWNFFLIEQDKSFGIHNPDFTFAVLGGAQRAVDDIPNAPVVSNEL